MDYQTSSKIKTDKASRYLQALCGHFNRKVRADWTEAKGDVNFGFGNCQMTANDTDLVIQIQAEKPDEFERLKSVIADHLERFAVKDGLKVNWGNTVDKG